MSDILSIFETAVKWIAAPVAAFVWLLHKTQQSHSTEIAVIKALAASNKEAHDREFKEMRENFKAVMSKLDSIELSLRKHP